VPVTSEFFAAEFPSVRPRSEIMRNLVLDLQGMNTMRPWQVALEEYLYTQYPDQVAFGAPAAATAPAYTTSGS
jgi:dTDP-4-dehydrorhamnose reductase